MSIFQAFPKLARLQRECVITEKLDGTNAQVILINPDNSEPEVYEEVMNAKPLATLNGLALFAGSRTRLVHPGKNTDNYGFAGWVQDNAEQLVRLGEGRHFGEWYGKGIQRNYGLNERRFALFDTTRYVQGPEPATQEFEARVRTPDCVSVVPELWRGPFFTTQADVVLHNLAGEGSRAVPGYMNPEGIVVWHTHARIAFKKTFDDKHKEA